MSVRGTSVCVCVRVRACPHVVDLAMGRRKYRRSPVKCLLRLNANCDGRRPGGMVTQANKWSGGKREGAPSSSAQRDRFPLVPPAAPPLHRRGSDMSQLTGCRKGSVIFFPSSS